MIRLKASTDLPHRSFLNRQGRQALPEKLTLAISLRKSALERQKGSVGQQLESGFVMPTILFLMVIMSLIGFATLMQSNNSLTLSYKQAYIQMARTASKAAIDYAQEQFDNSACGSYNGTAEQDLISNSRYRVTMKTEVLSTSADGYEKSLKSTGSVYLPRASASAKYVFDIRSELVRTYALCKTPDNFGPLLWLDASNTNSLKKSGTSTTTFSGASTGGIGNSGDALEERADNGSQTTASWQSNDFEMHTCDTTEFSNAICTNNATKYLNIGLVYSGVNIPKGATITSASLVLACTTPSGTSGSLTHRAYGIYKSASNPHADLFSSTGNNQLKTPLATANLHTTAFKDITANNCPPGNNTVFDLTNVVQEMINNTNWDPSTGRLGLAVQRQAGSGSRHLLKAGNQLNITYSNTTVAQANNGDSLAQWDDLSGNGNNAKSTHGIAPTRQDNQINSKTVVRFGGGDMLSSLTSALAGKREMTVLAVLKPNFSSSASDARIISGMTTSVNNDTAGITSIVPLLRDGSASGFSNIYASSTPANRTDYICGAGCANTPYLLSSIFTIQDNAKIQSQIKGSGVNGTTKNDIAPAGNPYIYGINQFYIGGNRSGAMPGSGINYMYGDFAELVIYDKALTCRQTEAIEEYLRAKWNTMPTPVSTTCPDDAIPTL